MLEGLGVPDFLDCPYWLIGIYTSDLKLFVAKGRCGYIWEGRIYSFRHFIPVPRNTMKKISCFLLGVMGTFQRSLQPRLSMKTSGLHD